jgi:hypothetical protein
LHVVAKIAKVEAMAIFRFPGAIALALLVGVITFSTARAEDKDLLKRLEALEKQNEELKKNLKKNVDSLFERERRQKKIGRCSQGENQRGRRFRGWQTTRCQRKMDK